MENFAMQHKPDQVLALDVIALKQLEKEIAPLQAKVQSLQIFKQIDPSILRGKLRISHLSIDAYNARVEHRKAEIEQERAKLVATQEAKVRSTRYLNANPQEAIFKKSGFDLISIESMDKNAMAQYEEQAKESPEIDFDAEPYTFRIPAAKTENDVRPYLERLPHVAYPLMLKSPDLKTFRFVSKLVETPELKVKDRIIYMVMDLNDPGPYPEIPLEKPVPLPAEKKLPSNSVRMDVAITKIRDLSAKLEHKMYILGMKEEKVNASQFEEIDEKVKQLGAKAKRLEEQLADQYRSNFGYLFQKVPSIDTSDAKVVVDCVAAWLEVAKLNPSQLRKHITSLETELAKKQAEAQKKSIKLEQKRRELTAKYNDYKSLMQEGKQIVAHMDIVSTKHFGPFLVSMHEKLSNELRQSLVHMKTELAKLDLNFDPAEQTPAHAFYDRLAPQNKPTFESDKLRDVQLAVIEKMEQIEKELEVMKKNGNSLGTSHGLLVAMKMESMQLKELKQQKIRELTALRSSLKRRSEAFEPQFTKLTECLNDLVEFCQSKWHVHVELLGDHALEQEIRLMVDDPALDLALKRTMTSSHSVAALILQLAINITIGSPFIIISGLDDCIESGLIDTVMLLLKQLIRQHDIQVILFNRYPQEEESDTRTLLTWYDVQRMEHLAETTHILTNGITAADMDLSQEVRELQEVDEVSQLSIQSTSSMSN